MRKYKRLISIIPFLILLFAVCCLLFTAIGCGSSKASGKDIYYCPMHPTYTSDRPGDCPICNMKLVKKETAPEAAKTAGDLGGHKDDMAKMAGASEDKAAEEVCIEHSCTMNNCPMQVRAHIRPGERIMCPVCGEYITTTSGKIVKIAQETSAATGPTVMISPDRQQLIGIKTGPVMKRGLSKIIRASGKIAYDPELVVTQEEFIQALNNEDRLKDSPLQDVIDRAKGLTEAARRKLRLLGMSDEEVLELERTRRAQTNLYLPGRGEKVWAYIAVYEYEIGLVKAGSSVDIEAVAYPGEIFQGKAMSINPILDPSTRTNQVRVEVENLGDRLKPEMFVNARIKVDLGEKLAIPESAVLDTGMRKIVYLSWEGGALESREVKIGQKAEDYYEVLAGLNEGDIVVTSGNFFVDSESRLKAAVGGESHQEHGGQ